MRSSKSHSSQSLGKYENDTCQWMYTNIQSTQWNSYIINFYVINSDLFQGYESTICAYGQTGTGKTYTMEGDLASIDHHGIIPKAAQAIFDIIHENNFSFSAVSCSSLEIYNEELFDLLSDDLESLHSADTSKRSAKVEIMDGKDGTFCRYEQMIVTSF